MNPPILRFAYWTAAVVLSDIVITDFFFLRRTYIVFWFFYCYGDYCCKIVILILLALIYNVYVQPLPCSADNFKNIIVHYVFLVYFLTLAAPGNK